MIYKFENKYPTIAENAFIAGSADVIGDYSIIGAGSVVTGISGILALDSPVKVIRELTEEEKKNLEKSAENYIDLSKKFKL